MDLSGITLQKLRLFVLVYERGSFNQAAQEMMMSQAAVSQHIKGLEQVLGVRCFVARSLAISSIEPHDSFKEPSSRPLKSASLSR